MSKYTMLLNILDQIRQEATPTNFKAKYVSGTTDPDQINYERARAFIHLYLKVSFGLLDFIEREHFVTDGAYDGGIDGYFIDSENRKIYLIQSKFRTTEENFSNKQMTLEEVLAMDANRIIEGYEQDERGNAYNGKILGLQREIRSIDDIARYSYRVILLSNLAIPSGSKLSRVVGGLPCEVVDSEKCFEQLVFPVISGTFFNASDLTIHLDLSNKNAGAKISYTVDTRFGECEITALFVPTIEIAKTFRKYKNSILKFNPRSYLELEGEKVNQAIRNTIIQKGKNEFALYNNGITMLSNETHLNERIGQKNKAQLNVTNPQIINGGQTAYTLSRVYEEFKPEEAQAIFEGKEVLLKVITLNSGDYTSEKQKANLIEAVSQATNLQTSVIAADRYSNEPANLELQKTLFDRYGLLYERKRGEFADGLHNGYIDRKQVVERNFFFRVLFAANGDLGTAVQKRLFTKLSKSKWAMPGANELDRFYFAYLCFQLLEPTQTETDYRTKEIYAKLFVMTSWFIPSNPADFAAVAEKALPSFVAEWDRFVKINESTNTKFIKMRYDPYTQQTVARFGRGKWVRSQSFLVDVKKYFETHLSN
ncbi:MAG: AIPR family protein [Candidatus Acidiferrales bacterium]